jgi:hypothetical protein
MMIFDVFIKEKVVPETRERVRVKNRLWKAKTLKWRPVVGM